MRARSSFSPSNLALCIFASVLIPQPKEQVDPAAELGNVRAELAAVHGELAALRELLTPDRAQS